MEVVPEILKANLDRRAVIAGIFNIKPCRRRNAMPELAPIRLQTYLLAQAQLPTQARPEADCAKHSEADAAAKRREQQKRPCL